MDNKDALADMRRYAVEAYPHEACGLIVAVANKFAVVNCRNISDNPEETFVISPEDYSAADDMGEIVAVWHSHTHGSCTPSEVDRAACDVSGIPWFIIGIKMDSSDFVFEGPSVLHSSGGKLPLLERPYVAGVYDCYTLAADYYAENMGITLGDYSSQALVDEWWLKGYSFFEDNFRREGFVELHDVDPVPGDIFLIKMSEGNPNHVAVFIENDMILHHVHGRLSGRCVYGGYWQKHTVKHLRHGSKC
jgi:proteasome lid subunit RPN8/RPN11